MPEGSNLTVMIWVCLFIAVMAYAEYLRPFI